MSGAHVHVPLIYYCLSVCSRKQSVVDFSADDVAKQMTVLDNELFQKVDVRLSLLVYLFCTVGMS